jgi:hypothetical protein
MSATPDAVMRRWFQEVWNERREQTIDELIRLPDDVPADRVGEVVGGGGVRP